MKMLRPGLPISRVMWPWPVVSSASIISPAPNRRLLASLHLTPPTPLSVITNWRRGGGWKTRAPPAGASRKITPSSGARADSQPYVHKNLTYFWTNFRGAGQLKAEVTEFAKFLKRSRPAQGAAEVLNPGEIEWCTTQARLRTRISVEEDTWTEIQKLAALLGVPME